MQVFRSLPWAAAALAAIAGSAHAQASRPYDGVGNNQANPLWGSANARLLRKAPHDYADGVSAPAGANRPNARAISNACSDQGRDPIWSRNVRTTMFIFWGQLIDHEMDLTEPPHAGATPMMIAVPEGDPFFEAQAVTQLPFVRNRFDHTTGSGPHNPREQVNQLPAFIDGNIVYGETGIKAFFLRSGVDGKLKTSGDNLLPLNSQVGIEMGNPFNFSGDFIFAAGDVRANENPALNVLHTIMVREHNRKCDELKAANPSWTDARLYVEARLYVGSLVQAITYNEFLPALLGPDAIPAYTGYQPGVNPGIANEFAHAAYRMGHTMINPLIPRYDEHGQVFGDGHLDLLNAFFDITPLQEEGGVDAILRGMARQAVQKPDMKVVDDLRNFLFPAGSGGLDLAAVNIQRGRDHGLASYGAHRVAYGLPPAASWADVTSDPEAQAVLASLYTSPDDADLWLTGLAEQHAPGSMLGPLFTAIIADQFTRTRDGDRFWYELVHDQATIDELNATTLADVIARNSGVSFPYGSVFHISVDYDANGVLNLDDIAAFAEYFIDGHPLADLNGDGVLSLDDIQIFIDAFQQFAN